MSYDLSDCLLTEFEARQTEKKGPIYYYAVLKVKLSMEGVSLKTSLHFKDRRLDMKEVTVA